MRRIILTLLFLSVAVATALASPKTVSAGCPPECDYVRQSCTGCIANPSGCYKMCRDVYYCITASCSGYYTYSSYYRVSCSLPYECTECDCSGKKECSDPCSYRSYITSCAKPAGCATPTPTPTTNPQICLYGDCGFSGATYGITCGDTQAEQDAGVGDTCIHLISPANTCKCTEETDPTSGNYVCEPYRPYQVVDGVCYQQWECCLPGTTTCFYQIRQTCEGGSATPSPTSTPSPSCSVSLSPSTASMTVGSGVSFVASVVPTNGTVDYVSFSSNDSSILSADPLVDSTSGYSTTATGVGVGNATLTAQVTMGGSIRCSDSSIVSVGAPGPWWQTKDSDVTANGELISLIPSVCSLPVCDPVLVIDGEGGFPGVPSYVGTVNVGVAGSVSSAGWAAQSAPRLRRSYSYSRFLRQVPSDVEITAITSSAIEGGLFESGGALSHGAYWYRYDGSSGLDLSVSGDANLGSRKVVLLVANADLRVGGKINLTKGEGLFMAIVGKDGDGNKGNVIVDPAVGGTADGVPELEGLFMADSEFRTGEGSAQLHVRGSVVGLSGILLQRDLDDDSQTPAECFEYAPDLILNIPSSLKISKYNWQEVAP